MAYSKKVIVELKEILDEPLETSQSAFTFAEIISDELVYVGMAEFRDAIFHIAKAIRTEDEALKNVDEAFEHIRRGGVESIQWSAAKRYDEVKKLIKTPSFISRLLFSQEKNEIMQTERLIRQNLIDGRRKKADKDKWIEAIRHYKKAIEMTDRLHEKCPTRIEYYWKLFMLVTGIATLAAFAIALANIVL